MLLMVALTAVLSLLGHTTQAARILGVFLTPSISHQVVYRGLVLELARRGHELVVATPDPINDKNLRNYKEIDLHRSYQIFQRIFNFHTDRSAWMLINKIYELSYEISDSALSNPEMEKLISKNSTEKFDLIMVEYLYCDATYGLMKRFNAPIIGMLSLPLVPPGHYNLGNPLQSAHSPGILTHYTDNMSFWERLNNFYYNIRLMIEYHVLHLPEQDKLLKKYFGNDMPYVADLSSNFSMVFVNSQAPLSYSSATVPNYLEIGGFHMKKTSNEIPSELKIFLDGAKDGFIYFSLGSNAKSNELPEEMRTIIMSAFAELPYRVLWKWETDSLPGKPDNVFISKWLPQQEVLAHPNILAFIYQGGLQSTEESIYNVVPLIGLPVFGDQEHNVNKLVSIGIAERLYYETLTKEEVKRVVSKVANDKGYKERVLKLRELLKDRMVDPMEQAIWWTEFVIRHKGAPHLQSKLRKMPWYQRELIDVLAFLFIVFATLIYTGSKLFAFIYRTILHSRIPNSSGKMKIN